MLQAQTVKENTNIAIKHAKPSKSLLIPSSKEIGRCERQGDKAKLNQQTGLFLRKLAKGFIGTTILFAGLSAPFFLKNKGILEISNQNKKAPTLTAESTITKKKKQKR